MATLESRIGKLEHAMGPIRPLQWVAEFVSPERGAVAIRFPGGRMAQRQGGETESRFLAGALPEGRNDVRN